MEWKGGWFVDWPMIYTNKHNWKRDVFILEWCQLLLSYFLYFFKFWLTLSHLFYQFLSAILPACRHVADEAHSPWEPSGRPELCPVRTLKVFSLLSQYSSGKAATHFTCSSPSGTMLGCSLKCKLLWRVWSPVVSLTSTWLKSSHSGSTCITHEPQTPGYTNQHRCASVALHFSSTTNCFVNVKLRHIFTPKHNYNRIVQIYSYCNSLWCFRYTYFSALINKAYLCSYLWIRDFFIDFKYVLISVFINIAQFKPEFKSISLFKIYKSSVHPVNS